MRLAGSSIRHGLRVVSHLSSELSQGVSCGLLASCRERDDPLELRRACDIPDCYPRRTERRQRGYSSGVLSSAWADVSTRQAVCGHSSQNITREVYGSRKPSWPRASLSYEHSRRPAQHPVENC